MFEQPEPGVLILISFFIALTLNGVMISLILLGLQSTSEIKQQL